MKKNLIVIVVVVVVLLVAGGWWLLRKPAGPAAQNGANANATQVIKFTPAAPAGQQQAGDCFGSSLAAYPRTDAWRCTVGDQIYDPCFSVAQMDTVVCGQDPLSGSGGFSLLLKKPLPAPTPLTQTPPAWGWLVQLKDGTVCAPFTGMRGQVNGKLTTYGCKPAQGTENTVILGELDSSKALWTAQVATISFNNSQINADKIQTETIAKVWQ